MACSVCGSAVERRRRRQHETWHEEERKRALAAAVAEVNRLLAEGVRRRI